MMSRVLVNAPCLSCALVESRSSSSILFRDVAALETLEGTPDQSIYKSEERGLHVWRVLFRALDRIH